MIISTTLSIIVAFDSHDEIGRCLSSIFRQNNNDFGGITLINNGPVGSRSDHLCLALSCSPIRVVQYQHNRGFGAACNLGVRLSPVTNFILLVNPDAEITFKMVERMRDAFDASPSLGIASPQLIDRNGASSPTASAYPTVFRLALEKIRRPTRFRRTDYSDNHLPLRAYGPADWVSGAVMMIRREAWDAVGGFDPAFFLYYEDIDLCRRVRAAGWEVGIVPGATAIHESGGSQWRPGTRTRVERIYFESQAYYFRKHYGRLMEWLLRAVRFPYLATSLRRRFLERHGVRFRLADDPA